MCVLTIHAHTYEILFFFFFFHSITWIPFHTIDLLFYFSRLFGYWDEIFNDTHFVIAH